jgi:hypothetical protein
VSHHRRDGTAVADAVLLRSWGVNRGVFGRRKLDRGVFDWRKLNRGVFDGRKLNRGVFDGRKLDWRVYHGNDFDDLRKLDAEGARLE